MSACFPRCEMCGPVIRPGGFFCVVLVLLLEAFAILFFACRLMKGVGLFRAAVRVGGCPRFLH